MTVAARLEGARADCERRMAELAEGSEPGQMPRLWFEYNSLARSLTRLVYQAEQAEGVSLGSRVHARESSPG